MIIILNTLKPKANYFFPGEKIWSEGYAIWVILLIKMQKQKGGGID